MQKKKTPIVKKTPKSEQTDIEFIKQQLDFIKYNMHLNFRALCGVVTILNNSLSKLGDDDLVNEISKLITKLDPLSKKSE